MTGATLAPRGAVVKKKFKRSPRDCALRVVAVLRGCGIDRRDGPSYHDPDLPRRRSVCAGRRGRRDRRGAWFARARSLRGGVARFSAGIDVVIQDMGHLVGYCLLLLLFLFIAEIVADRLILHSINNAVELKNGNVAVGLAEFGIFVATGMVAYGSFHGEGGDWTTALGFFALGQAALIAFAMIYEWATPFKMVEQIRQGNAAAGLMLGGTLVTLGIILEFAIAGPFTTWGEGIRGFMISVAARHSSAERRT